MTSKLRGGYLNKYEPHYHDLAFPDIYVYYNSLSPLSRKICRRSHLSLDRYDWPQLASFSVLGLFITANLLGVSSSSTAAVTKRIDGNREKTVWIPRWDARTLTKMMFSSGTPRALMTSMAVHAEPPVASIGSRIRTAVQKSANLTLGVGIQLKEDILLVSIPNGSFEYKREGRHVVSSRWINILPKLRGPLNATTVSQFFKRVWQHANKQHTCSNGARHSQDSHRPGVCSLRRQLGSVVHLGTWSSWG